MSPQLQAAARFVVDHPNEVVIMSMRALAERARVQPATLVRLAQQLGHAGWPALKSAFAEDMGLHSERYGQRAKNLAVRGREADLVGELFAVQQDNLLSTQAKSANRLSDAARLLKRAKAVHIAGFRASHPVAYALFYGYRLFRNSVRLIDGHSGGWRPNCETSSGRTSSSSSASRPTRANPSPFCGRHARQAHASWR